MPYTLLLIAALMLGGCGRVIVESPRVKVDVDVDPGTDELKAPPPPTPIPRPRPPRGS